MAERLIKLAEQLLAMGYESNSEHARVAALKTDAGDAAFTHTVKTLVVPILSSIPATVPDLYAQRSRAQKAKETAEFQLVTNNTDSQTRDRFVNEDTSIEQMHADWIEEALPEVAMQMVDRQHGLGDILSAVHGNSKKARSARRDIRMKHDKAQAITDYMADNVARLLMGVKYPTRHRYCSQPDNAPWMSAVFATGPGMKLKQLMSAEAQANYNEAYALDFWFKRQFSGTGATAAVSRPANATKAKKPRARAASAPAAAGSGDGGGSSVSSGAATAAAALSSRKAPGECANPSCASLKRLVWCKGCGLAGCVWEIQSLANIYLSELPPNDADVCYFTTSRLGIAVQRAKSLNGKCTKGTAKYSPTGINSRRMHTTLLCTETVHLFVFEPPHNRYHC